jgi:NitT/TauT family transport system substrate-binding protein
MRGRRQFLRAMATAGVTGLAGWRPPIASAEPPPETTRLRLVRIPSICQAPQYVADDLFRSEGFTDG